MKVSGVSVQVSAQPLAKKTASLIKKYSICNLQFSIPACPGWDISIIAVNYQVKNPGPEDQVFDVRIKKHP